MRTKPVLIAAILLTVILISSTELKVVANVMKVPVLETSQHVETGGDDICVYGKACPPGYLLYREGSSCKAGTLHCKKSILLKTEGNNPNVCGNRVCEEPYETLVGCPQDCGDLIAYFDSSVNESEAEKIIESFGEDMIRWFWIANAGEVLTDRDGAEKLAAEMRRHPKIIDVYSSVSSESKMIVMNYRATPSNCNLTGYLGGSEYRTEWEHGGSAKLRDYTVCFYYAHPTNGGSTRSNTGKYMHFYIAKMADVTEGNVNTFDKMLLEGNGGLKPSASASDVCLSPWVMDDSTLKQIIDNAIKEYMPECLEGCVCAQLYDPVCGVDGKTYPNSCEARCAGVEVDHHGPCEAGGTAAEEGNVKKLTREKTGKQKPLIILFLERLNSIFKQ